MFFSGSATPSLQPFALEPLGFKSKLPEQVTEFSKLPEHVTKFCFNTLFSKGFIVDRTEVIMFDWHFSPSYRWLDIPLNLAQSWKLYLLLFIILRFHLTTKALIISNITNPLATSVLLLTMIILVILCFCGSNNTIVLTTLRLYLVIASHTRNQWKVPWRSARQWRVAQFK